MTTRTSYFFNLFVKPTCNKTHYFVRKEWRSLTYREKPLSTSHHAITNVGLDRTNFPNLAKAYDNWRGPSFSGWGEGSSQTTQMSTQRCTQVACVTKPRQTNSVLIGKTLYLESKITIRLPNQSKNRSAPCWKGHGGGGHSHDQRGAEGRGSVFPSMGTPLYTTGATTEAPLVTFPVTKV